MCLRSSPAVNASCLSRCHTHANTHSVYVRRNASCLSHYYTHTHTNTLCTSCAPLKVCPWSGVYIIESYLSHCHTRKHTHMYIRMVCVRDVCFWRGVLWVVLVWMSHTQTYIRMVLCTWCVPSCRLSNASIDESCLTCDTHIHTHTHTHTHTHIHTHTYIRMVLCTWCVPLKVCRLSSASIDDHVSHMNEACLTYEWGMSHM